MRWPSSPGKGGASRPGSSRLSLAHNTMRAMLPPDLPADPPSADQPAARAATLSLSPSSARIVLFGIRCHFTDIVLDALQRAGRAVVGVILPGPPAARTPLELPRPTAGLILAAGEAPPHDLVA